MPNAGSHFLHDIPQVAPCDVGGEPSDERVESKGAVSASVINRLFDCHDPVRSILFSQLVNRPREGEAARAACPLIPLRIASDVVKEVRPNLFPRTVKVLGHKDCSGTIDAGEAAGARFVTVGRLSSSNAIRSFSLFLKETKSNP